MTLTRLRSALLATAVLLLLWQAIVTTFDLPRYILPGPLLVVETLWTSRELIAENAWVTIVEILAGLVIGVAFGAGTAIAMAGIALARSLIRPLLILSQAVPVFALAPILTLWLGYGLSSKILISVLIIYFPVTSAFYDRLVDPDPGHLDLARSMGASRWTIMRSVRIPTALPALLSGIRLAAVYAPIGAVIGEWVGASRGLGYLMLYANGRSRIDLMFAALVVLAVFTVALHAIVDRLANRIEQRRLH